MAKIQKPEADLPRNGIGFLISGGADFWDEGIAGEIVTNEYFGSTPTPTNKFWLKVSGVWKEAVTWIKISGVWKQAEPKINVAGIWK